MLSGQTQSRARSRGKAQRGLIAASTLAIVAVIGSAVAQQPPPPSIPGLVISTTPPPAPTAPPAGIPGLVIAPPSAPPGMAIAPPQAPQPPPPAAKPKPKPAPRAANTAPAVPKTSAPQGIAALVNDEPITAYQVDRRATFMSLSSNFQDRARANLKAMAENPSVNERLKAILESTIRENQGKSREAIIAIFERRKKEFVMGLQQQAVANAKASLVPGLRKKALDELIDERIKLQEAKKLTIAIADDDVERAFKGVAERNKMTTEQFMNMIRQQGADGGVMKERIKVQLAWREVIRKKFGHMISVSTRDVERLATSSGNAETEELQIQRITFSVPGKIDQAALAQRYDAAEAVRRKFSGCKTTASLVKDQTNVKFEDLGYRSASTLAEPTRTFLVSAKDGEMVPASLTAAGVELYAVCGRRTQKISDEKRQAAESELTMREFERRAQSHLFDLRTNAHIEIR